MPRALWRRRRATDSPRPAGRRWAGQLRRSGSLARQVILAGGVRRRRGDAGIAGSTGLQLPAEPDAHQARSTTRGVAGRGAILRRGTRPSVLDHSPGRPDLLAPSVAAPTGTVTVAAVTGTQSPDALHVIPLLPGKHTVARRLRFGLVNGCTIASLVLGMSAIFMAVNHTGVRWAALCLIACVIFDGLDGALARRLGVASPFGAQLDSLADMCSFGIAAPVVVYAWLAGSAPLALVVPACALVAVCAAIRLARFNVSPKDGRFFCGVPTTMAAAVMALGTLIAPRMPAWGHVAAVAVLALAMVSTFPYAKLPRLLRLPPWALMLPVVGALVNYQVTFAAGVGVYLVSGPLIWLRHRSV